MELIPHPDHPPRRLSHLRAMAERAGQVLRLRFEPVGDTGELRVAPGQGRTDELWRSTCFEAFLTAGEEGYREFNFAPSGAWAAYAFDRYREGMRNAEAATVVAWDGRTLTAEVVVPLCGDWRLNLTAVIEEQDGTRSFWALAHPPGPPDFHHPDCFVLELPAVG